MNKQQLVEQIIKHKSFLCVGLDPDVQKIPKHLLDEPDPIFEFNSAIIDATSEYCIAYKPNFAFYEMYGSEGIKSLEKTIRYIKVNYPDKFIIADAKRGDIGNTSEKYAYSVFEKLECDAITLSPYMGRDSILPFLKYQNRWAIILAVTSNEGSADFQLMHMENKKPLYINVIEKSKSWGNDENIMYVVGATQNKEIIKSIREIIPDHFILIPGIGAQGGSLENVCDVALNKDVGIIVNVSRDIIYAGNDEKFALASQIQAQYYQQKMQKILNEKKYL
ncbi:MAG TPA: orotidine-5'-phosphate decarboxylase [Bacteroidia bacterium]|nr:orotidine-5'-phosphate decarboxylase [Bacteroidia bacterium]